MTLSRDSRMDRRRRMLLDASAQAEGTTSRSSPKTTAPGEAGAKKSAGYSQDVRQACGTRLVQFIPVRRRSFMGLIAASILITTTLLVVHYLIYVSETLPWYGHPLVIAMDLAHPRSIASWLGSHLWLLCLGTTILTFQLRRHKLDDYNGEYRLWFWLVITCVLASIDSTTHISELFAMGLDRWSLVNIGWSGQAVVTATMATLVGMLGLRLCTELKTVPLSLVCWLIGLVAWAGSAALAQERLILDMTIQTRVWLKASLWLCGLTSIWIAAVAYLRYVYIDAQKRFLARGRLARSASAMPLGQRVRQSLPFIRRKSDDPAVSSESDVEGHDGARWSLRRMFARKPKAAEEEKPPMASRRSKPVQTAAPVQAFAPQATNLHQEPPPPLRTSSTAAPLSAVNRSPLPGTTASSGSQVASNTVGSSPVAQVKPTQSKPQESEPASEKKRSLWPFKFKLWPGKDVPEEEAIEYRKLRDEERERAANERKLQREAAAADKAAAKQAKQVEREATKQAKRDSQAEPKPKKERTGGGIGKKLMAPVAAVGGMLKKIKLPSLSAFKLSPPDGEIGEASSTAKGSTLKPVSQSNAIPGTGNTAASSNAQRSNDSYYEDDEDADDDRQLSKADRKKLRRQNRAA